MGRKEGFLFADKVGMLGGHNEEFKRPIEASIKLVQNGYELHYDGKEFIAKTLDEGMKMIKKWMTTESKEEKEESNSETEEN